MEKFVSDKQLSTSLHKIIFSAPLTKLNFALKHVKLGKAHLIAAMGAKNFNQLMKQIKIYPKNSYLYPDAEEKIGAVTRMIITIITSSLGIWLGLNDFLLGGYRSLPQLIIVSTASLLIGAIICVLTYFFTKKKQKEALSQKKILDLKIDLINNMIKKLKIKIEEIQANAGNILDRIGGENRINFSYFFEENKKINLQKEKHSLLALHDEIKRKTATKLENQLLKYFYNDYLMELKKIIEKMLSPLKNNNKTTHTKNDLLSLFECPPTTALYKISFASWLAGSGIQILLETIPVFIGTFAAIFLFLNGLPDVFIKLGYGDLISKMSSPLIKYSGFTATLLLVLYLAVSQIKYSYHSYLKNKNIADSQNKFLEKELHYFHLYQRYALFKKFYKLIDKLSHVI